jgi:hypothetical protein
MTARLFILFTLLLGSGHCRAAEPWAKLRLGMTAAQAARALGEPLLRTVGQGFELWIYDQRAEVLFYGPLVGWTSPGSDLRPGPAVDVWSVSAGPGKDETFFLPRPTIRVHARRQEAAPTYDYLLPSYRRH